LDRLKHAINKDRIQERGQGASLSHTAVHSQRGRKATSQGYPGRAALIEGIDEAPHLTCHTFMSEAIKKCMVHHSVIRLTPVEEGQARQFAALHSRPHCGIQSKEGICSTTPTPEAILVIIELNIRAHPLQEQVCEEFGDGRKECQATVVGTVGEIP
jgi:hypothetical protein